jgi:four helix bundle protein
VKISDKVAYKTFKDMPIWQNAINAAEDIFRLTESLPKKEDYGLTSQLRRAALSISSNIAEAYGRHHISDKINFYYFSRGSVTETQSQLEYANRVGYIDKDKSDVLTNRLSQIYNDINKIIVTFKNKR